LFTWKRGFYHVIQHGFTLVNSGAICIIGS
jgi:hypothetical protein